MVHVDMFFDKTSVLKTKEKTSPKRNVEGVRGLLISQKNGKMRRRSLTV